MKSKTYVCVNEWVDDDCDICFIEGNVYIADDVNMIIDENGTVISMHDSDVEYYFEEM